MDAADQVFVSDAGTSLKKADIAAIAKYIVENYAGSTIGGSAQSVQAAIGALNSRTPGGVVDIRSYSSSSNMYTTTTDGYLQLQGSNCRVVISNGNTIAYSSGSITGIYIKRGISLYVAGTPTLVNFISLR